MKICICGGGSLGHVCAGVLASQRGNIVSILSGHPEKWNNEVFVNDCDGKEFRGRLTKVSKEPEEVLRNQDIVLLCLPGYLIEETLIKIKPFVGEPYSISTETYIMNGPYNTLKEAENVVSYMKTKFFHLMLGIKKITQHTTQKVFEMIPLQDFSHPWTDEMLYKKYNLTDEEIAFIESMIRPME